MDVGDLSRIQTPYSGSRSARLTLLLMAVMVGPAELSALALALTR